MAVTTFTRLTRRAALLGIGAAAMTYWRLQSARGTTVLRPVPRSRMRLGINLAGINYYSPNDCFIDYLKGAGVPTRPGTVDANGMPLTIDRTGQANGGKPQDHIWYFLPLDNSPKPIRYHLLTDGKMTFGADIGRDLRRVGDNHWTFSVADGRSAWLIITAIAKPPTYMNVVRDDELAAFRAGEIFKPSFLDDLKGFAVIRMLNWSAANGLNAALPKGPDGKPIPKDYLTYGEGYVPLEIQAALTVKTGIPGWFHIIVDDTDAQVAARAAVLDPLAAKGLAIIEYGNELANNVSPAFGYCYKKAVAFLHGANGAGAQHWGGIRSAQLVKIMPKAKGYKWVLGCFPSVYTAIASYAIDGLSFAKNGVTVADFHAWTCSNYVGPNADAARIQQWAANDDPAALMNDIRTSKTGKAYGSIRDNTDRSTGYVALNRKFADAHGLKLFVYEGGYDLSTVNLAAGQPATEKFRTAALNTPEAQAGMSELLEATQTAGPDVMTLFDYDSLTAYGLRQRASWPAIRAWIDRAPAGARQPASA